MGRSSRKTDFAEARDRLFSEVLRCGVREASATDAREWMDDTVEYLGDLFPALTDRQLDQLRDVGRQYLAPVIPHGAINRTEPAEHQATIG